MLGPVLLVVFIDDIDENIRSTVFKFADDTKVVARVGMEDREVLRGDLCSGSIVVTTLDCGPGGSWFEFRVGANIL